MTSRPSTAAPTLAVLAVGLVIYVSAYFVLVRRMPEEIRWGVVRYTPRYLIGAETAKPILGPIHRIDKRWIRPWYWEENSLANQQTQASP